jgi:hypothetical protein
VLDAERQLGFVVAPVKHRHGMAEPGKLADDRGPDETRSPDDQDARDFLRSNSDGRA